MLIRINDLDDYIANEIEDNFRVTDRYDGKITSDIEVMCDIETYGSSVKLIDHDTDTDYVLEHIECSTITIY